MVSRVLREQDMMIEEDRANNVQNESIMMDELDK